MKIKKLSKRKLEGALPLIWKVFCEYEAVNYPEDGKAAFWNAIHSDEYLDMLTSFGAYVNKELVGIIATRNEGTHLSLFFVDAVHQGNGIGRSLWNMVLAKNKSPIITVHSSLYAVPIYQKLGFVITNEIKCENGIQYVPMEYRTVINKNCPCSKKCIRHGKCNECRAHHAKHNRSLPCERKVNI
ncbi:MAG: GNAT family N-acetyltransferase [Eubacteriales bacterium]